MQRSREVVWLVESAERRLEMEDSWIEIGGVVFCCLDGVVQVSGIGLPREDTVER